MNKLDKNKYSPQAIRRISEAQFAERTDKVRRLEQQRDELLAALKRARKDLIEIRDDDRSKIDPQFAIDRIEEQIANAERAS